MRKILRPRRRELQRLTSTNPDRGPAVLFEKGEKGGECLNTGCVPSKALLAAARAVAEIRNASRFGISAVPDMCFSQVMNHVRHATAAIAPHDSAERFEQLSVRVIRAQAQFTSRNTISGGGYDLRARRIIIATGSRAAIPQYPDWIRFHI
jgi:pyruvate/2-oxoglutarate dehydrogenase complex dihydrolipoamide dehydrogenase (E3) component